MNISTVLNLMWCVGGVAICLFADNADAQQLDGKRLTEAYPDNAAARYVQKNRDLQQLQNVPGGAAAELVFQRASLWLPGDVLKVAFEGGGVELHHKIVAAANIWSEHANIRFDFGWDEKEQRYASFSDADHDYRADIRIAFRSGDGWGGDWSAVGNQSVDTGYFGPGDPSMNLETATLAGLEEAELRDLVLHEFGHALGAEHEHQNPAGKCDDKFRWDVDAGYVSTTDSSGRIIEDNYYRQPGLYTLMSGAPDYWSREKVDYNLRQLPDSSALVGGPFDAKSIMLYRFPEAFYWRGKGSKCFWRGETGKLSDLDKQRINLVYPDDPKQVNLIHRQREKDADFLSGMPALPSVLQALERVRK